MPTSTAEAARAGGGPGALLVTDNELDAVDAELLLLAWSSVGMGTCPHVPAPGCVSARYPCFMALFIVMVAGTCLPSSAHGDKPTVDTAIAVSVSFDTLTLTAGSTSSSFGSPRAGRAQEGCAAGRGIAEAAGCLPPQVSSSPIVSA